MHVVAFTICAANYLHHAVTLGDSLKIIEPNVKYVIGLVDDQTVPNNQSIRDYEIIPWSDLRAAGCPPVADDYSVIEFCTAVKPSYFLHLMQVFPSVDKFFYIDPDIRFYGPLQEMVKVLDRDNMVLTPHSLTPQRDVHAVITPEVRFLMRGVYNLGFIGMRRSSEVMKFLTWWADRLRTQCRIRPSKGLFVDQKWMDLAPCFLRGVHVSRNPGANVAYWNLYERELKKNGNQYESNCVPLMFYHFSAMDRSDPARTVARFADLGYSDIEALTCLYHEYATELEKNGHEHYSRMVWQRPDGPQVLLSDNYARRFFSWLCARIK